MPVSTRRHAALAAGLLMTAAALAGAGPAAGAEPAWQPTPVPMVDSKAGGNLQGVRAYAADDAWTAGYSINPLGPNKMEWRADTHHWDGTRWNKVPVDRPQDGFFNDIDGVASDDQWAVGVPQVRDIPTYIQHWDGHAWKLVPGGGVSRLNSVHANSANDVWAAGYGYAQDGPIARHWDGNRWSTLAPAKELIAGGEFFDVTATGPNDVWAVGAAGAEVTTSIPLIAHWDGKSWTRLTLPNKVAWGQLTGVAVADGQVWAVGATGPYGDRPLTYHVDRAGVRVPPLPGGAAPMLSDVAATGDTVQAVGAWEKAEGKRSPYVLRWQNDRWETAPAPPTPKVTLNDASGIPGIAGLWAIGGQPPLSDHRMVHASPYAAHG